MRNLVPKVLYVSYECDFWWSYRNYWSFPLALRCHHFRGVETYFIITWKIRLVVCGVIWRLADHFRVSLPRLWSLGITKSVWGSNVCFDYLDIVCGLSVFRFRWETVVVGISGYHWVGYELLRMRPDKLFQLWIRRLATIELARLALHGCIANNAIMIPLDLIRFALYAVWIP